MKKLEQERFSSTPKDPITTWRRWCPWLAAGGSLAQGRSLHGTCLGYGGRCKPAELCKMQLPKGLQNLQLAEQRIPCGPEVSLCNLHWAYVESCAADISNVLGD